MRYCVMFRIINDLALHEEELDLSILLYLDISLFSYLLLTFLVVRAIIILVRNHNHIRKG